MNSASRCASWEGQGGGRSADGGGQAGTQAANAANRSWGENSAYAAAMQGSPALVAVHALRALHMHVDHPLQSVLQLATHLVKV
jgi:hypothetical protein